MSGTTSSNRNEDKSFTPRDAWIFFALLLLVGFLIWGSIYLIMLSQS